MPIVVPCPGCPTKLSVPEAAAGKPIRCPKCGTAATAPALIPAEEVPVVDAAIVSPPPRPRRVRADEDDGDDRPREPASRDGDDEDRPRKKKRPRPDDDERDPPRRRPRRRTGGGAAVAIAIGGLVLVAVLGASAYLLVKKNAEEAGGTGSASAKRAPVPAGWQLHSFPEDGFRAYFPTKPSVATQRPAGTGYGVGWSVRDIVMVDIRDAELITVCYSGRRGGTEARLTAIRYRGRVPVEVREQIRAQLIDEPDRARARAVKWFGNDAIEQTDASGPVGRVGYADRLVFFASINGPIATRVSPEEEAGFFDNIELMR